MSPKRFQTPAGLPGQRPVVWRKSTGSIALALAAGVAWPPLILTMLIWPPQNWVPGRETDWRLTVLLIGIVAVPLCLKFLAGERERTGRPTSRLGIVWRFMLYGGLLAAALQALLTLLMVVLSLFEVGGFMQGVGAIETILLIYGVGGLPIATLVGISYALWSGLCVAFLAFHPAPQPVRDRLGVLDTGRRQV